MAIILSNFTPDPPIALDDESVHLGLHVTLTDPDTQASVVASMDNGVVELVFVPEDRDGGVFIDPYLSSTADLVDGSIVFTIVRTGGYPAGTRLAVFGAANPAATHYWSSTSPTAPTLPTTVLQVVGVIEDGGIPSEALPQNARQGLEVQIGTTFTLLLKLWTRSGAVVRLGASTVTLTVGQNPYGGQALLRKTGTVDAQYGPNAVTFAFSWQDTQNRLQGAGQYVYDVWLTDGVGNKTPIVPASPFTVLGAIP